MGLEGHEDLEATAAGRAADGVGLDEVAVRGVPVPSGDGGVTVLAAEARRGEIMRRYPHAFDAANRFKLALGYAPVNNGAFRQAFPQYDVPRWWGKTLVHHHIGRGGQAIGVPEPIHRGTGEIDAYETRIGLRDAEEEIARRLQAFVTGKPTLPRSRGHMDF